jgi:hypothetical protein
MTEDLADHGVAPQTVFTVYAEPPWQLHLAGELDLDGAPALTSALEGPTQARRHDRA